MKLFLILIISLEISLVPNLVANITIIIASLGYLTFKHLSPKKLLLLFLIPLFVALVVFTMVYHLTPGYSFCHASVLLTRIHAYVFLGATFIEVTNILSFTCSLGQDSKLPSKLAYGILAVLNVLPRIHVEANYIRLVGDVRHYHLFFYSPTLYFKAILAVTSWSNSPAEGMISCGYREDKPRDVTVPTALTKKDWFTFSSILVLLRPILFFMK